jgi:zinc and cadmium transporter
VLVYGGFTKKKALIYNFISGLAAMAGAILGYFMSSATVGFSRFVLPLTAGGFIYIATSDLIPQIHKESHLRGATPAFIFFLLGIVFMALTSILLKV